MGKANPFRQLSSHPTLPPNVTNSRAEPQQTPSVEKHAHPPRVVYCAIYPTLTRISKGGYPVTLLPPPRRLAPSLGLGTTWVSQPRSGSCHYPTAATKYNEQPSQSHSKPRQWKSMLIHQGWFTALYTQHLLEFPREAIPLHYFPLREDSPRVSAWGLHG